MVDLYNIPNDTGSPWREHQFLSLFNNVYVDGADDHCLLKCFANEFSLNDEQKLYLCFLYGLTYSTTSTFRIFRDFNNLNELNYNPLSYYWLKNKKSLYFDEDNRWIKSRDLFVPSLLDIKKGLSVSDLNDCETFNELYTYIKQFKNFGSFRAFLVLDAMTDLLPHLYIDGNKLPLKECATNVKDGLAHLSYKDEWVLEKKYELKTLNKTVEYYHNILKIPIVKLESMLCVYSKYFKGTRYVGFYADRLLQECFKYQIYCSPINLFKYRKQAIPKKYLSELKGQKGINKQKLHLFKDKGIL